jgi:predicted exporter
MRGQARTLIVGALLVAGLGAFVASRLEISTDITHFLPGGEADADVTLARQLATSELTRTMVLLVEAADSTQAVATSRELEAALRAEPRVGPALAFLEGGPPEGTEEALWELYEPRRLAFLASDPAQVEARLSTEGLATAAARLKRRLALPISGLLSRVVPGDPLLILPDLFERLAGARAEGLRLVEGRFLTADGRGAVLFLGTQAAPFDSTAQRPFLAGVRAAFESVNASHGGRFVLRQSGANRFSLRAEESIQADIGRVSIWSFVLILPLLLLLFRSLRLVLLTLPIVAVGSLAGTAACLAVFGSVHGLTLAFGAALIGVSVDYPIHFYCHQMLAPAPAGPRRTLEGIWPGMVLGAATTIVGFVALVLPSFPGLREFAVFGSFGIAASLVATRALLPPLVPAETRPTRFGRALVGWIERAAAAVGRRRPVVAALVGAVVLVGVIGSARIRWNDDVADLGRLDPELMAEDAAIREQVLRYEGRRFVVAVGEDEQGALALNDRVAEVLAAAQAAGELGGYRTAATLLPSAERQRAVDSAVRADTTLWPRLQGALAAEGFVVESFAPFRDALQAPAPDPLVWQDLAGSALAPLVRPFRVSLGDGVGLLSFVLDLREPEALEARLAAVPGARLVDVGATLTRAYGAYRARMLSLLLVGLAAVVGLVALRHRALRPTLVACAPALLAALGTVGLLSLFGVALNLLSLVALLMIVSMGDDFGIFLAEAGGDRGALDATHLSVSIACLTTIVSFGLLALSDEPALFTLGLTSVIGAALTLLFAVSLGAFFRRPEDDSSAGGRGQ